MDYKEPEGKKLNDLDVDCDAHVEHGVSSRRRGKRYPDDGLEFLQCHLQHILHKFWNRRECLRTRNTRGLYNRVFVANLKYNVDNAKLREIFSLAGNVITADVIKGKDGQSRGFGVVEMDHPVEAFQALSLFDNRTLYDRPMFVRMDREAVRSQAAQSELSEVRRSIECRAKYTNGHFYNRVFVANLKYEVDDAELREVFSFAGKVSSAVVAKDKDGKSRGFGVVEMNHPIGAFKAISCLNNRFLYDRRMTVRMDHEAVRDNAQPPKLPEGLRSIGMGFGADGNPLHDVARNLCCCCWQDIKALFQMLEDEQATV